MNLMLAKIIAGLALVALIGFGVNWFLNYEQQIGYDRRTAEYVVQENADLKAAMQETIRLNKIVETAQNEAKERDKQMAESSSRIATLSSQLRNSQRSIDTLVSTATTDALRKAATAFNALFEDCRGAYEAMGRAAAGHSSDVVTLEQACVR